jgi:hypothetical protein
MALHLKNVRIDNCGTGISAPKDVQIHADGLEITNTRRAIELRDPPGLLQSLGLPAETPLPYLIEALNLLEGSHTLPPEQRIESLRESSLVKWLGVTADLTGLGTTLLSAQAQGLVSSVVERIVG